MPASPSSAPYSTLVKTIDALCGPGSTERHMRLVAPIVFLKASQDVRRGLLSDSASAWASYTAQIERVEDLARLVQDVCQDEQLYAALLGEFHSLRSVSELNGQLRELLRVFDQVSSQWFERHPALWFLELLSEFALTRGRTATLYPTPSSVNSLLAELAGETTGSSVHDPFAGMGLTLFTVNYLAGASTTGVGVELNRFPWIVGRLAAHLAHLRGVEFHLADSLREPLRLPEGRLRQFHTVVTDGPVGLRKWNPTEYMTTTDPRFGGYGTSLTTRGDLAVIQHCLGVATHRAVVTTLPNVLYRTTGVDKDLRSTWVRRDILESVIQLPGNLRAETSLPITILTFALAPQRKPDGLILFIDASEADTGHRRSPELRAEDIERIARLVADFRAGRLRPGVVEERFATAATAAEIMDNEYDLSLPRYVALVEEVELPTLGKLRDRLARERAELAASEVAFDEALAKLME